jgi:hypothetical protein
LLPFVIRSERFTLAFMEGKRAMRAFAVMQSLGGVGLAAALADVVDRRTMYSGSAAVARRPPPHPHLE